jgi:hypothetical protein
VQPGHHVSAAGELLGANTGVPVARWHERVVVPAAIKRELAHAVHKQLPERTLL